MKTWRGSPRKREARSSGLTIKYSGKKPTVRRPNASIRRRTTANMPPRRPSGWRATRTRSERRHRLRERLLQAPEYHRYLARNPEWQRGFGVMIYAEGTAASVGAGLLRSLRRRALRAASSAE